MPSCPSCGGSIAFDDDMCFACGAVLAPDAPPPPREQYRSGRPEPYSRPRDDYMDEQRPPPRRRRDYPPQRSRPRGGAMGAAAYDDPYYPDEPRVTRIDRRPPQRGGSGQRPMQLEGRRRSGKSTAAGIVAIFCIILLLMVLYLPQFQAVRDRMNGLGDMKDNIPMSPYYREFPEGAEFTIDRTVVVEAYGSFSYTIKIAQPMDINDGATLVQDTLAFQPSKSPDENTVDVSSTQNIMLIWDDTISGGSDSLTVRYHVKTQTRDWLGEYDIDGSKSGTVDDINGTWKTVYNTDEWRIDLDSDGVLDSEDDLDNDGQWNYRIEPSNPAIISLSNQLTSGKTNVYDKLLSIYEYLISDEILDYETIRGGGLPKACTTTLSDLKGDCDDYSILFISLARAANIPARLALGLLYDPDNDQWIGHGWSEVYIPMKSGGAILGTVDVVNKQFLLRDPYRLTDWLDTGGDVVYNGEYVNNLDFYYYSFTYRGPGKKVSDDYNTVSYKPLGGKVRVEMSQSEVSGQPSNGDGSSGTSYLPGFEAFSAIFAASVAAAILAASGGRRRFKHR